MRDEYVFIAAMILLFTLGLTISIVRYHKPAEETKEAFQSEQEKKEWLERCHYHGITKTIVDGKEEYFIRDGQKVMFWGKEKRR
jgi:hypothetical protein